MSRAALSKSRAEKGKVPASQTPVIAQEIVPGKFNDNDWSNMLDRESEEEFVLDIVDEILNSTMDTIYDKYIERQILPFTVTQAKDAILQIIEWQFLMRDEGEVSVETAAGWQQDDEPEPAITDCWAQGAVPKKIVKTVVTPIIEQDETVQDIESVEKEKTIEDILAEELPELEDKISDNEAEEDDEEKDDDDVVAVEPVPDTKQEKKKVKYRPHRGPLRSAGVSRMTESLEETELNLITSEMMKTLEKDGKGSGLITMPMSCHSILKVQAGRPPGQKDVVYDDRGNVISVVKIDPDKLPQHKVRVGYKIVDPTTEAVQSRLEAMRSGKYISAPKIVTTSKTNGIDQSNVPSSVSKMSKQPTITPLPPPLIDAIDVSSGVIVKEGGRIRKGPNRFIRRVDLLTDNQDLKPISTKVLGPAIDVSDILDRTTPILRPIKDNHPLPPIMSNTPPVQ